MNQELVEKAKKLGLPLSKEFKEHIKFPMDSDKLVEYINKLKEKYSLETIPVCMHDDCVYFRVSILLTDEEIQWSINQCERDAKWKVNSSQKTLEIINTRSIRPVLNAEEI